MSRPTRHELKEDELITTFEWFQRFAKQHYQEMAGGVLAVAVIIGGSLALHTYSARQENAANAALGAALRTFRAYIGPASAENPSLDTLSFPTVQERDQKALSQFLDIIAKFPRQKAAQIARYHVGMCQAEMGDHELAIKTLEEASHASDKEIASLAKFGLAGELAGNGKFPDALKLYQELADHPTLSVPKAAAMLAEADAQRTSNPATARKIYEQLQKDFASNPTLASTIKQQLASLPQ